MKEPIETDPLIEEAIVSFGEYLLSDERYKMIESHPEFNFSAWSTAHRAELVHHADVENWKHRNSQQKQQ